MECGSPSVTGCTRVTGSFAGMTECKFLHSSAERAGSEDQLTRGIEIDFLRAAEALRLNPDLAHSAVELQKQIDQARVSLGERENSATGHPQQEQEIRELQRKLEEANAKLASLQSNTPRPAPTPTPAKGPIPVAMPARPPPRHPTLHMGQPRAFGAKPAGDGGGAYPGAFEFQARGPVTRRVLALATGDASVEFPGAELAVFRWRHRKVCESNAHPGNAGYGLNGQATPPPRQGPRTPWRTLLSPHRPRPDDHDG